LEKILKAIILAAGKGKRLEKKIPKPLVKITNEKTILDSQVEKLSKKIGQRNIIVTVGYKKESILNHNPNLIFVYNLNFHKTQSAKSTLLAIRKIDTEDVIILEGDIFFDEVLLDLLIKTRGSACLVDKKQCGYEESKYNLNKQGLIHNISKSNKNHLGEYLGIILIRKNDLKNFRNELESVATNDRIDKAIENLTTTNQLKLKPVFVEKYFCRDIDFKYDLETVKKYISRKNSNI